MWEVCHDNRHEQLGEEIFFLHTYFSKYLTTGPQDLEKLNLEINFLLQYTRPLDFRNEIWI